MTKHKDAALSLPLTDGHPIDKVTALHATHRRFSYFSFTLLFSSFSTFLADAYGGNDSPFLTLH